MSMSVTVLCPGGRRQVVKVTPNTSILQILEEATRKQGLDSKHFIVQHYNKRLDVSSTVRFSNLPNRAQLELVESDSARVDGDVTLAVQLPDGDRQVKQFNCNTSLWQVLQDQGLVGERSSGDEDGIPTCIYARREVVGEQELAATTLRSLGLTGGKAIIRFSVRAAELTSGSQAHVSAPLAKAPAQSEQPAPPTSASPSQSEAALESPGPAPPAGSQSALSVAPANHDVTMEALPPVSAAQISEIDTNAGKKPDTASINISDVSGASVAGTESEQSAVGISTSSSEAFVQEGQSLGVSGSSEDITMAEPEERIIYLGDRDAVAFSLDDVTAPHQTELPDDFFDITEADVRRRLKELRQQIASLEESGPLMTSSQREARHQAELLSRLAAHRRTVIRVQFTDRLVLQGVFLSTDTVEAVENFVRQHLATPVGFSLYTTPPKTVLPSTARLFEVDCVPSALVHVSAAGGATAALSDAVKERLSSPSGASKVLSKVRPTSSVSHDISDPSAPSSSSPGGASAPPAARRPDAAPASQPTDRPGVPKWFKMPLK